MPRKPSRKGLDDANLRLFSQIVRAKANWLCEVCGKPTKDAHHMVGRGCRRLRYEPRNGLSVCGACHDWAGTHHFAFSEWVKRSPRDVDWEWVQLPENQAITHWTLDDYLEIRAKLRVELAELQSSLAMGQAA